MKIISVFDTTISDYNLGNEIIMESVYNHLRDVFPDDFFYKLPYMEITRHTLGYISNSDLVFFGGTNSLSSKMEKYKQWDVNLYKSLFIKDVILMGLGWWQYQNSASLYTKLLLRRLLSSERLHSVRDSYTEKKLRAIGFLNVVNTGCPTLWNLTPTHCSAIRVDKSDEVVMTLTDYNQDADSDRRLVDLLLKKYRRVRVWLQGVGDKAYIDSICSGKVDIIPPSLQAFDEALSDPNVDYVGTRLHAGIRALQKKRRTIIIAVDNRALEMKKDFALPVISREDTLELGNLISDSRETKISLPHMLISQWKAQFANLKNVCEHDASLQ